MAPVDDSSGSVSEAAEAKRLARAHAREARDRLSPEQRASAAYRIAEALLALDELAGAQTVLAHAALPTEIDPAPAIARLRERGVRIAYPRIESPGVLGLHYVSHELDLVPGPFGLAQPIEFAPRMHPNDADALLLPGIAFDERGMRLGYGGGYYDRLLPQFRSDCVRIGLGFDEQVLAEIPAESHDEHVDIVVTPTRVIRPNWASS
jgi:5-formyltetrahydrofolate cyclo-ligase